MKWRIAVFLSLQLSLAAAQVENRFSPSEFQDTIPPTIYNTLNVRLEKDKAEIPVKGKVGSYIKSLYDQRFQYVVKTFNADYVMPDHPITSFLDSVLNRIYNSNPQLARDIRLYSFSSSSPNAVSFGEGTVFVMLGLLERLETEDQVCFVICHELAHYYANHSRKHLSEMAALNYDRELKAKIDKIMSSPYGQYSKLKELFGSLDLSINKHSRRSEFEADSLALVYYLKTGYNAYAPLRVMQILEKADRGTDTTVLELKKSFDNKEYPFKDSWLAYNKTGITYRPFLENGSDTLRTHPDCVKRFRKLQRQLSIMEVDSALIHSGKPIKHINTLSSLEVINSHYHFKQYGKALFYSLIMSEKLPNHAYPRAMVAKSLYQLYVAQKNHQLSKVLEMPDPRYDENYDRLLTFVSKLRLHELAVLAYQYAISQPESFYQDEEFIHALWLCSRFDFSKVDSEKVKAEYLQRFPKGRYVQDMTNSK